VADIASVALAAYVALSLATDGLGTEPSRFRAVAIVPILLRPIVAHSFALYRRAWAQATVTDLLHILGAVGVGTIASVTLFYGVLAPAGAAGTEDFPRAFWLIEPLLTLSALCATRFVIRALSDVSALPHGAATVAAQPVLMFGAGNAGALMARSCRREQRAGVVPVGFLDDDARKHRTSVAGVPVLGGLDDLERAVAVTGARMLLITMPHASGEAIRRVMNAAVAAGMTVRTVPPLHELVDGTLDAFRVRRVRVEDLLTRQPANEHAPGVDEAIRDNVVMITGAGGSIGSELARQVYAFGPRKLVLVDRAESSLYLIQRELELRAGDGRGAGELSVHLTNVASRAAIGRLVADTLPAVIFHAAAYKHVPMMEEHPSEGAQVNIGGTMAVVAAAVAAGVPRFVLVSTDKAVEPSSIMGATKRIAEWIVADAAKRTGNAFVAVRFGNVLGSAGSILPIIESQLEKGEALTITDPGMTRYFMTIQEAGLLILDAAAVGRPGDLFVLDMGHPIRIMDLVRDVVRLAGRDMQTVRVKVTGFRPGEKLHEKLFYDRESVEPTDVEKILRVKNFAVPADIQERAHELLQFAFGDQDEELRRRLFAAVAGDAEDGDATALVRDRPSTGRTHAGVAGD